MGDVDVLALGALGCCCSPGRMTLTVLSWGWSEKHLFRKGV